MRALVVEDEPVVQQLIVECLYNFGFDFVDSVTTGRALYTLGGIQYDVMLVDVMMPDWTGLEGLELARAFGNRNSVIIVTGRPDLVNDEKTPVLTKPFSVSALRDIIESVANLELKEPKAGTSKNMIGE